MRLYRGKTIKGNCIQVKVENKRITEVKTIESDSTLPLIATPLVDTQNNGAQGQSFNQISDNPDMLYKMKLHYHSHGVGKVVATITTQPLELLKKSGMAISDYLEKHSDLNDTFPGFFHEGIYISKEDGWRGSHSLKHVRDPNYEEFKETNKYFQNRIKLVNVAPEEPNGLSFIEKAVSDGITAAIGHCNPDSQTIKASVKAGATFVTHFGNGSAPMIHRHKNPFWGILAEDQLHVGLIADTFHLPTDFLQATLNAKGKDKCIFLSDCSSKSGLKAGEYEHHSQTIVLEPNGYMHVKNKEILAGSWHQLDKSVETLCKMGWDLADAWLQCSDIPANFFNIKQDKIEPGHKANFVLSTFNNNIGLQLNKLVFDGEEVEASPVNPIQSS